MPIRPGRAVVEHGGDQCGGWPCLAIRCRGPPRSRGNASRRRCTAGRAAASRAAAAAWLRPDRAGNPTASRRSVAGLRRSRARYRTRQPCTRAALLRSAGLVQSRRSRSISLQRRPATSVRRAPVRIRSLVILLNGQPSPPAARQMMASPRSSSTRSRRRSSPAAVARQAGRVDDAALHRPRERLLGQGRHPVGHVGGPGRHVVDQVERVTLGDRPDRPSAQVGRTAISASARSAGRAQLVPLDVGAMKSPATSATVSPRPRRVATAAASTRGPLLERGRARLRASARLSSGCRRERAAAAGHRSGRASTSP